MKVLLIRAFTRFILRTCEHKNLSKKILKNCSKSAWVFHENLPVKSRVDGFEDVKQSL